MNLASLDSYKTFVFDCDGVVLDSNRIKTEAFRVAAQAYGSAAADALVAYHVANGGISRYAKFAHFLEHIVPEHAPQKSGPTLEALLDTYANQARLGLQVCAVAKGLDELRAATPTARWLIVSGGDQQELRSIFRGRELEKLFDGGIFGSPDSKPHILEREVAAGNIKLPALFIGDSRYDHEAAEGANLDFVFIHGWTEFRSWKEYCNTRSIASVSCPAELIAQLKMQEND